MERDIENQPGHIELAQRFTWGKDLGGSDETIISQQFDKPVFVTDYPSEAKAFYMKESEIDPRTVRNVDLLAPEGYGEIIGGSQREDNLEIITRKLKEKGLEAKDYDWYLDLRRYGSVPHGGFGLGIERLLSWICGLKHVRETIPFPRTMGRIWP
jgi:asparaginyl-tRNA synthetase